MGFELATLVMIDTDCIGSCKFNNQDGPKCGKPAVVYKCARISNLSVYVMFLFDFGTVPTVWYFCFFYLILELYRQCGTFVFSI